MSSGPNTSEYFQENERHLLDANQGKLERVIFPDSLPEGGAMQHYGTQLIV